MYVCFKFINFDNFCCRSIPPWLILSYQSCHQPTGKIPQYSTKFSPMGWDKGKHMTGTSVPTSEPSSPQMDHR